jgi:membrane protein
MQRTEAIPRHPARQILKNPLPFVLRVLKAFHANQGLLLAGALAYYTLLSIIPLFTFLLLVLSHVIDEGELLATLTRYIGLAIRGGSDAIIAQIKSFLQHREVAGWIVLGAMLSFSLLFRPIPTACDQRFRRRQSRRQESHLGQCPHTGHGCRNARDEGTRHRRTPADRSHGPGGAADEIR